MPCVVDCIILTCMCLKDLALEKATYNWPWEKTGSARKMRSLSKVWPWDLLTVIEYESLMGNWILCKVNGRAASDGANLILGSNTLSPAFAPVKISASKTRSWSLWIINLVPLQRPLRMSRFRSNIMMAPTFKDSLCGGMPEGVKLLRNSGM